MRNTYTRHSIFSPTIGFKPRVTKFNLSGTVHDNRQASLFACPKVMATVFEVHKEHEPIYITAPSFSLVSSSTPVKNTSHNARSEKKEEVAELLWSEMRNGGWVKDNRVLDRFKSSPTPDTISCRSDIPQTVAKEEELYRPLVDYVNTLIQSSTLQFINSSRYDPKQSRDDSKSTNIESESAKEDIKQSQLRPDLLGMLSADAESFVASVKKTDGNTWLYWMLVRIVWE